MHGPLNHNALSSYLPKEPRGSRAYADLYEHVATLAQAERNTALSLRHTRCCATEGMALD
jgi:hypothetical protein